MSKITVTQEQVESQIVSEEYIQMGDKTCVGLFTLKNGFVVVESSSCVDPANYDIEIGKKIIKGRVLNKIWELEGYCLQSKVAEQGGS